MKWYQMRWAQKYWGKEARERYRRYLQSNAWKTKRKTVLQAARFRCRRCGAPATEVHHETYKRIYKERLSDLTALCSNCSTMLGHKNVTTTQKYLGVNYDLRSGCATKKWRSPAQTAHNRTICNT